MGGVDLLPQDGSQISERNTRSRVCHFSESLGSKMPTKSDK